ncbi:MAG: HlyD family efflux transporter periplasmic adaptor subunit [Bacteroidota bacterium]
MPKSLEEMELRPPEVQEILNKPPNLLLRAGPILLLILVVGFMCATSFISYPETVEGTAHIIAIEPPQVVQAPVHGVLTSLSSSSPWEVRQGLSMGTIQDPVQQQKLELLSPVDGYAYRISFHEVGSEVKAKDSLFLIVPKANRFYAIVEIPSHQQGQIQLNQEVSIKLDSYPSEQDGELEGMVHQISPFPQNNLLTIKVIFPEGLKTSTGKLLSYIPNLQGQATVMVEDVSVLDRLIRRNTQILPQTDT